MKMEFNFIIYTAELPDEQSLCFGTEEYIWNDIDEVEKILGRGLSAW